MGYGAEITKQFAFFNAVADCGGSVHGGSLRERKRRRKEEIGEDAAGDGAEWWFLRPWLKLGLGLCGGP
ncbi:hypothetical protein VNO78_12331 [Psophocarpus tetragonolobus]|uniref:Uncharacterized protein n=1 Tax=Psophocarpus tetragonolobus TaxID=3891 RepID=A0AAN9XPF8_PSOTE